MEEVVELLKLWEPEKAKEIEGIDDFYIANVEKYDQIKFPASYHRFAKTMASDLGPIIFDNGQINMSFHDVRQYFNRHIGEPRYFLFSKHSPVDKLMDNSPYFLDLEDPYGDDFAVVQMPKAAARSLEFEYAVKKHITLREMLIYWAYWSVRVPQFKYKTSIIENLIEKEPFYDLEIFELIADQFGLQPCPYLDFWKYYDGKTASFCVTRNIKTHQIEHVNVFSNEKFLNSKIVEMILNNTPLEQGS